MKIGIILTPDVRSKSYIQKVVLNKIELDEIIFMTDNRSELQYSQQIITESKKAGFDISKSVLDTLLEHNLKFTKFNFVNINNTDLIKYVSNTKVDYFIFTGGGILKKEILNTGPKFIHLHPGLVPYYRGSTCFYYSIIKENNAGVTAFIMDEHLDTGDVICQKSFPKPNHQFIDEIFDPYIRSETLLDIFKKNLLEHDNFQKQSQTEGETYYIIHPVLKHIAILNCVQSND